MLCTSRSDCLSVVQVLVPSIKPFVLLLPVWQDVLMLQAIYPIVWPRILHAECNPWEKFFSVCPRLEPFSDFRCDAATRAKNGEPSKATDLQQTPYPRVIYGRYCIKVKKAELKLRYSHKAPVFIEELKSFVGIAYGLPPPVSDSIVIDIGYAKEANFVYVNSVSARALLKECCEGFEIAEFEGFANIDAQLGKGD